jgi:TonB family protein
MKLLKILFTVGLICSFYYNSFSQTEISKELIDKDVAMFQRFFQIFPLSDKLTVVDLNKELEGFTEVVINPIGFEGNLHWWVFNGGTTIIDANILSYNNKIVMVEATIYKKYMHHLDLAFKENKTIKKKFNQLFALKTNLHYINDSVYQYIYTNQPLYSAYQDHISMFLGKQTKVETKNYEFEYDLLNRPTERFQFLPVDRFYRSYAPVYAVKKLLIDNKTDLVLNILKGPSLYGRIYAISGLLVWGYEGKYILTSEDKKLIRTVLDLNLNVEDARYDGRQFSYSKCIDLELLKVLEDDFKFKEGSIYPEEKPLIGTIEQNPEFKGGYENMQKYLKQNLIYPSDAVKRGISGTVFVQFVISETGKVSNAKILRGIGGGCDEEALRVVRSMPDWIPGRIYGKVVKVMFQIPVKYAIPIRAY